MTINFKNISDSVKKFFKRTANIDLVRNPDHDWDKLLVAFVLLLLATIAFHSVFFYKISQGQLFKGHINDVSKTDSVDRQALLKTSELYTSKEQAVEALKQTRSAVVDPSQ
jgi:hypothetical protein